MVITNARTTDDATSIVQFTDDDTSDGHATETDATQVDVGARIIDLRDDDRQSMEKQIGELRRRNKDLGEKNCVLSAMLITDLQIAMFELSIDKFKEAKRVKSENEEVKDAHRLLAAEDDCSTPRSSPPNPRKKAWK